MRPSLKPSKRLILSTATLAVLALAVPIASFATAILATGVSGGPSTCEVGTCPDPNVIATSIGVSPASSSINGLLNFTYTFTNGDKYQVSGFYDANYNKGLFLEFAPTVTYIGNTLNVSQLSAGSDTLSLDFLQNVYDNGPGSWNSPPDYCEHFGVTVAPLGSATADVSFDNNAASIGTLTAGPGASYQSLCSSINLAPPADTASFLNTDFNITTTFAARTNPGTIIGTLVPEPGAVALTLMGCLFLAVARNRRLS